jgi:environmental stress-induced protein Ves
MTHRLLGPNDYRRIRRKNEGGRTTEIAKHPAAADLEEFAWRASIADVTHGGAFSEFPGVARTLVLLSGAGMQLERASGPLELRVPFEAVDFDGAEALGCTRVVESAGTHDPGDGALDVHPASRRSVAIVATISARPAPGPGSATFPGTPA